MKRKLDQVKQTLESWSKVNGHDEIKRDMFDAYSRADKAAKSGDIKEAYRELEIVRSKELDLTVSAFEGNMPPTLFPFEAPGAVAGAAKFAAIVANPKAWAALKSVITNGADVLRGFKPADRINVLKDFAGQFTRMGKNAAGPAELKQSTLDRVREAMASKVGNGAIGKAGSSTRTRLIEVTEPLKAAEDFFDKISKGGTVTKHLPNGGKLVELPGGAGHVTLRPISKSGPPTVDVKLEDMEHPKEFKFIP